MKPNDFVHVVFRNVNAHVAYICEAIVIETTQFAEGYITCTLDDGRTLICDTDNVFRSRASAERSMRMCAY